MAIKTDDETPVRKRGRKKTDVGRLRKVAIMIRFTPDEIAEVLEARNAARRCSTGDWARLVMLDAARASKASRAIGAAGR